MIATLILGAMLSSVQSTPGAPAALALVTTYADGTTHFELISPRSAWYWTPKFPGIDGSSNPPSALKLTRQLDGDVAKVVVSLLYFGRQAKQREVEVASVRVPRDGSVVVDEVLRRYGVQPIRLSLATVPTLVPFPPSVFSDIPELEISGLEILTAPYPGYRLTVRNLSNKAASSFGLQSYRGEAKALSGLRSGTAGRPVLLPMDSYSFDLNLTSGNVDGPIPLDVIEITSVLWADGSSAGDLSPAARAIPVDAGGRVMLEQAKAVLQAALDTPDLSITEVLARLETIPERDETLLAEAQRSRIQAKRAVINDVRRFQQRDSATDGAALRAYLQTLVGRYETIVSRLSPL